MLEATGRSAPGLPQERVAVRSPRLPVPQLSFGVIGVTLRLRVSAPLRFSRGAALTQSRKDAKTQGSADDFLSVP